MKLTLFLTEHKQMLMDPLWPQILAYLSDIFTKLNELNLGLRLKSYFADQSLVDFWGSLKDVYCVSEIANSILHYTPLQERIFRNDNLRN